MRRRRRCSRPFPIRYGCRSSGGLLRCGCRNVGCMEANVGQSQSCISQHLMRLKAAGIVKASRSGNEVYYEIDDRAGVTAIIAALFGDREEDYRHDV